MTIRGIIFFIVFILVNTNIKGQSDDYSESPYFLLEGKKSEFGFPLLANKMEATILGPIADVTIRQTYKNTGEKPIEAVYVFPASTRAAVYHMEMIIGDRTIIADVKEKKEARKTYEKAKSEGKRTSLLEQHRPNVFQMNVANIMPGEEISVVMKYTEYIIPEEQEYTFVYPAVVGPRYTGEKKENWAQQMYSSFKGKPSFDFDISINMQSSIPVAKVKCDTHHTSINQYNPGEINLTLDKEKGFAGDRDFILKYSLSGDEIETGVKTFEKDGEHFFLCQMEAPMLSPEMKIVPREYIFIIDVSGSMRGFPLSVSKDLMRNLFSKLKSSDKFNVMFFAGSAFLLGERSFLATEENINYAMKVLNTQSGRGGTNMLGAIKKAMNIPKDPNFSRSFVISTDGYVTVEEEAFQYISDHLNDANFYAFGIGNSVNRFLIEGLAHVGGGAPFIVSDNNKAAAQAERLRKYIQYPVLSNINITGHGVELYDVIPEHIPDLMAGRPIYFFGKYKPDGRGQLEVRGNQGGQKFVSHMLLPTPEKENLAISYLWAREKIRFLDDFNTLRYDEEKENKITSLGLKYNLLTKYTSFVAVDDEVVNKERKPDKINQILSIPKGMNNLAIGFEMELEEMVGGEEPSSIDITIASSDAQFKQIAEILLESIMRSEIEMPSLDLKSIEVDFDDAGLLKLDKEHALYDVITKLGEALKGFGYELKDLKFSINFKKLKK